MPYCRGCQYDLFGLSASVCPECGRRFDPTDPRTTSPNRFDPWGWWGGLAEGMTRLVVIVTGGVILLSAIGMEPLWLWVVGFALAPFGLLLLLLVCLPRLLVSTRTRVRAVGGLLVLASVILTSWPFRVSFALHRAALDRCVARIRSNAQERGPLQVGMFFVRRVQHHAEGPVGLQLSGGSGGGVFLVHIPSGSRTKWYNLNWEVPLGDGWYWIYED